MKYVFPILLLLASCDARESPVDQNTFDEAFALPERQTECQLLGRPETDCKDGYLIVTEKSRRTAKACSDGHGLINPLYVEKHGYCPPKPTPEPVYRSKPSGLINKTAMYSSDPIEPTEANRSYYWTGYPSQSKWYCDGPKFDSTCSPVTGPVHCSYWENGFQGRIDPLRADEGRIAYCPPSLPKPAQIKQKPCWDGTGTDNHAKGIQCPVGQP